MDFRVGGMWLYSMTSPTNDVHWCKADYLAIDAGKSFSHHDNFCDENGNVGEKFPNSKWNILFRKTGIYHSTGHDNTRQPGIHGESH